MLSTKNIVSESSSKSKTLNPGTQAIKINDISVVKGYEADSLRILLNVEGPDMGEDFEGFLVNYDDKEGAKYHGQIGRVRLSQFDYKDGVTKTGKVIRRDQSILQTLLSLAKALGKEAELNQVEANTIEDFIAEANTVLSGSTYINAVLGGKTYEKNGYTKYDLFLPYGRDGKYAFEAVDAKDSKLMEFNPDVHIIKPAPAAPVENFEPTPQVHSSFSL